MQAALDGRLRREVNKKEGNIEARSQTPPVGDVK
jgi:hypothetical protein